jgi:hypothetical protein
VPRSASSLSPRRHCSPARVLCCTLILVTALAAIRNNVADPDLWGHVQYGREVLSAGEIPAQATWTYTSSGPWVNHENIAELILAGVGEHLGATGLGLMKLMLTLVLLGMMLSQGLARRASVLAIGVTLILAAESMQFHWHFRPHLFGFLLFGLMIALLNRVFWDWQADWHWLKIRRADGAASRGDDSCDSRTIPHTRPDAAVARMRWLWLGPVILCVWTNTHGGFAAGLAIWCTYLSLRIVEAWCSWGPTVLPLIRRLAMMIAAGILATLINPYGPTLHYWLAADVWLPRPEISDWQPLHQFGVEMWAFWSLLLLVVVSFSGARRWFSLTETVILLLVTWQALAHVRHALFFAILCGFWLPHRLSETAFQALRHNKAYLSALRSRRSAGPGLIALLTVAIVLLAVPVFRSYTTVVVDRGRYPVAAMQYIADNQLYGRTVVAFNWAQYAIGCFANDPAGCRRAEVAVDGRLRTCYPQEVIDIYLDLFLGQQPAELRYRSPDSPDCDPARALVAGDPELLLIERHNPNCRKAVQQRQEDWVMLYQDQIAQIWGRRDIYDNIGDERFIPLSRRRISNQPQEGLTQWPALPSAFEARGPAWTSSNSEDAAMAQVATK